MMSSAVLPRKRSFANANPASVQKKTVPRAIAPATTSEFRSALNMSTWSSASRMLEKRFPPGVSGGGVFEMSAFVRDAATTVQ
jgi:hypothetical protein